MNGTQEHILNCSWLIFNVSVALLGSENYFVSVRLHDIETVVEFHVPIVLDLLIPVKAHYCLSNLNATLGNF